MRAGLAVILLGAAACTPSPEGGPSTASTPVAAVPWFEDVATSRGISFVHRSGHETRHLLPEIMGGGAALLDIDGDRDLDLLLVQSGRMSSSAATPAGHHLYRNRIILMLVAEPREKLFPVRAGDFLGGCHGLPP